MQVLSFKKKKIRNKWKDVAHRLRGGRRVKLGKPVRLVCRLLWLVIIRTVLTR